MFLKEVSYAHQSYFFYQKHNKNINIVKYYVFFIIIILMYFKM